MVPTPVMLFAAAIAATVAIAAAVCARARVARLVALVTRRRAVTRGTSARIRRVVLVVVHVVVGNHGDYEDQNKG